MPEQNLQYDARHAVTVLYSATVAKHRFVSWAGAHATDGAEVQGVSELGGPAGKAGSLVTAYSYLVEAASAIPVGAEVGPSSDGTGRAVVATGAVCGRATSAAAAAGELVQVVLRQPTSGVDGIASRYATFPDGQPLQITRPVLDAGKCLAYGTDQSQWTVLTGTVTKANYSAGWDANGNITGIVSRSGAPGLLKLTPTSASCAVQMPSGVCQSTNCVASDGVFRIGVWVYLDLQPGYGPGEALTGFTVTLRVGFNADNTTAFMFQWNSNQLREGWNFLNVAKTRAPTVAAPGNTAYAGTWPDEDANGLEAHFLGTVERVVNNGATHGQAIMTSPVVTVSVGMEAAAVFDGSVNLYVDSVWGGYRSMPQLVFGCDATGADVMDLAKPIFDAAGLSIGYIAPPRRVANPSFALVYDWTPTPADANRINRIEALAKSGADVINHTVNHNQMGTYTSVPNLVYEIDAARGWYHSQDYHRGAEFYASPQSSTSRLSEKVIKARGIVAQRHARKQNIAVTPFGLDNPHHLGAIDMGARAAWQKASLIIGWIRMLQRYGDTGLPFWHVVTTLGDDGTGEQLGVNDLTMPLSNLRKVLEFSKAEHDAGRLYVCNSFSDFYYGGAK